VKLLHRTTRRLHLTELGAAYALRCAEIARLAEEANRAVTDAQQVPRGTLRVTADPVFGEAFVTSLVIEHARRWPQVQVEVVLTSRRVDLVEEGFDVAFRVGQVGSTELSAVALGPARVRYCASPAYLRERGAPRVPDELRDHECLHVSADGSPGRWPFRGKQGPALVPVQGRLRFNSFAMAYQAALAGLGIAICPEFTCAADLARGRLQAVLQGFTVDAGAVYLVHPTHRYLTARVRTFVELARERLKRAPWMRAR
jgi:DNA-binding transcriptional LysR family regulator